jgi:hypothetical protein
MILVVPPGRIPAYRKVNNQDLAHVLFLGNAVFTNSGGLDANPGFSELLSLEKIPAPGTSSDRLLHFPAPALDQAVSYVLKIEEKICPCDPGC